MGRIKDFYMKILDGRCLVYCKLNLRDPDERCKSCKDKMYLSEIRKMFDKKYKLVEPFDNV